MENLIEELKAVMEEKDLSPEAASRFIECSYRQVYRWIRGEAVPNQVYRRAIKRGINKMKKLSSVSFESALKDRDLYRKLRKKARISVEEKDWLLDCMGNYSLYRQRLRELAKKYKIES